MAVDAPVIRDSGKDVVEAGAFRLTLGTQVGAAIAALVVSLDPIFGDAFLSGQKTAIIIAAIAAFAVVTATDILARSWTSCCSRPQMALAPRGVDVRNTPRPAAEEPGWTVVAVRAKSADPASTEFLIVKQGEQPEWVDASKLEF